MTALNSIPKKICEVTGISAVNVSKYIGKTCLLQIFVDSNPYYGLSITTVLGTALYLSVSAEQPYNLSARVVFNPEKKTISLQMAFFGASDLSTSTTMIVHVI